MFNDDLSKVFKYNPDNGCIIRLIRMGNYRPNTICDSKLSGYVKVTYKGVVYLGHRLAWFLYYNEQPPEQIDHINGVRSDNRITNLRATNHSTNQMNISVHKRSQTGIKGIMPVRGGSLYRAEVCIDGKRYQKHSKDIKILESWVKAKRKELHQSFTKH
jgi:hypothetical protein